MTGGRILLIEDQRNVAESLNELLGYYGFFVDHTGMETPALSFTKRRGRKVLLTRP